MTSDPQVGAKALMARATITDLLKLPFPATAELSGHIWANELRATGRRSRSRRRRRRKRGYPREQLGFVCPLIGTVGLIKKKKKKKKKNR